MSFKPQPNQQYYIIPKGKTDHVIGAVNGGIPAQIEELSYQKSNEHQRFRFDPVGDKASWMLLPPFKERYLVVDNSSKDDGARIIQYKYEVRKTSFHFQFLPAGDGYYRIMNLNSNKFFEIVDRTATSMGRVIQKSKNNNEGQFFSVTPVPDAPSDIPPIAFDQKSDIQRTATLSILGKVPEVGAGLSFVVGLFWKANDPLADLWNQMKTYVDARVKQLILESDLTKLSLKITDQLNSIAEISRVDEGKYGRLMAKIDSIRSIRSEFMSVAKVALPYLVAIGNVELSLRRTVYTDYDALHAKSTETPADGPKLLKSKAQNLAELRTAMGEFKIAFDEAITALVENRMSKIHWNEIAELRRPRNPYEVRGARVFDDFDGWTLTIWNTDSYSDYGHTNYKEWAEYAYNQRKLQVQTQYDTEMKDLGKMALLWEYFDQVTPLPVPVTYKVKVGAFGGLNAHNPFNGVDNSTITAIEVFSQDGNLCGLEVFYNGTGNGIQGKRGNKTDRLNLEGSEFITSVYGYYNDYIYGLWFVTSNGKIVGAGKEQFSYFCADIADGLKGRLEKISGFNDVHTLQQLNFHWKYSEVPPKPKTV
jgi:hypothetical protein